jgi:hypothetical protein
MTRAAALVLVLLSLGASAGCYERVVAAKGYGADQTTIAQPNLPREGDRISGYKKIDHKEIP